MRTTMLRGHALFFTVLLATCVTAPCRAWGADSFPLRDGDTWVMLGDSITAQHLHTNYIEAFCYARYPTLTFHFRNSGVSGDTIPRALDRFAWDVAAWKPTLVSVELGMNDKGGFPVEKYIGNMGKLSEKITALGARPVFITASPINSGETMAKLGSNAALNVYAMALKNFAAAQNAPYADQFHALIDVWGRNKPRENLANLIKAGEVMARDNDLRGVESLRAFLAEQGKDSHPPVSMQGDTVHPGPPGQLMMAAAILKDLHAEGFVSSLTLDATGKVLQSKGCVVENVQAAAGKLSFDRLDQCLPFPIHNEARVVLPLCPAVLELSQYSLQISGLPGGQYALDVNGKRLATLDAQELAAGVNLTAYGQGPIEDQGHTIVGLVGAKENLVGQWRTLAKMVAIGNGNADIARQMEKLRKSIDEADARIRREAQPRQLHFLVVPIGQARS